MNNYIYSCPMKTHHLQKLLYPFNVITIFIFAIASYCTVAMYYVSDMPLKLNAH